MSDTRPVLVRPALNGVQLEGQLRPQEFTTVAKRQYQCVSSVEIRAVGIYLKKVSIKRFPNTENNYNDRKCISQKYLQKY